MASRAGTEDPHHDVLLTASYCDFFFFFALFWPHFTHHKGTNDYQHLLLAYRTSWEALKMEKKKKKEREIGTLEGRAFVTVDVNILPEQQEVLIQTHFPLCCRSHGVA